MRLRAITIGLGLLVFSAAFAQEGIPGQRIKTEPSVYEPISAIVARQQGDELFYRFVRIIKKTEEDGVDRSGLPQSREAVRGNAYAAGVGGFDAENAGKYGGQTPFTPQTTGTSFDGGGSGSVFPPDSMGGVGPNQVMVATNSAIRVYNRTGGFLWQSSLNSFYSTVGGNSGTSDPFVRYDRTSGRWFVSAINLTSPNRIMLAVSTSSDISTSGGFNFFFASVPAAFADYTSLGVDKDAVYIGENTFNTSLTGYLGAAGTVFQKASVLSAGTPVVTRFTIGGSSSGIYAPRGVTNDDPASTQGYFVGVDAGVFSRLVVRKINNPGSVTPTLDPTTYNINVLATNFPQNVPCSGSTSPLSAVDDRLFAAEMRLNRKNGLRTLWTAHNIEVDASGNANGAGNRNGMRWYELQSLTGSPTVRQSGTLFDASGTPLNYWMGSAIMSGQGHAVIGASTANSTNRAGIAYSGRLFGDGLGTVRTPTQVLTSGFTYNAGFQNGAYRWGDYSMTVVDPMDDQTMWTFQQYVSSTNVWQMRVVQLRAPAPAAISSVVPNSAGQGANLNVVVNGTVNNFNEYYDTDATYPNRLQAAFSGTGVTVNSVTFNTPTQVTLNVSVSGGATAGPRDLTITNPDGQTTTLNGAFTVTGGQQAIVPNEVTVGLGQITGGDVASLSTTDGNVLRVCKFVVPFAGSPYARINVFANNTGLTNIASGSVSIRDRSATSGLFQRTLLGVLAGGTGATRDSLVTAAFPTSLADYSLTLTAGGGSLNDYLGTNGRLGVRWEVLQTGPSAALTPCAEIDKLNWLITP